MSNYYKKNYLERAKRNMHLLLYYYYVNKKILIKENRLTKNYSLLVKKYENL